MDPLGGGGRVLCPWDDRTFPLLSLIFHTFFNSNYSRSPASGGTIPETGLKTSDNFECS